MKPATVCVLACVSKMKGPVMRLPCKILFRVVLVIFCLFCFHTVFPAQNQEDSSRENAVAMIQEQDRKAGNRMVLTIKDVEYPFCWCPAETFTMGSPDSEFWRIGNEKQHSVTFTKGYWMLETEVTQQMWEGVTGKNRSRFKGAKLPVERVSWEDCQKYISQLNDMGIAPRGMKFSLPTDAQWEYACRAGTTTPYHFGSALNGDNANCNGTMPYGTEKSGMYLKKTVEAGSYPANAWGLYDMHGNVWEWCSDWYGADCSSSETDPTGPTTGSFRVIRGGGLYSNSSDCRSAIRICYAPPNRGSNIGFRLALVHDAAAVHSISSVLKPPESAVISNENPKNE